MHFARRPKMRLLGMRAAPFLATEAAGGTNSGMSWSAFEVVMVIAVVGLIAAVVVAALWLRQSISAAASQPRDDQSMVLLQGQVNAASQQMAQQVDSLRQSLLQVQSQLAESMSQTRQSMDTRLDRAAEVIQGVSRQLGQLDESARNLASIGKDISSLQNILRAPKLRGNLGELFLEDLLRQILPEDHFLMQHAFRGGDRVDAVIVLKAGLVPVDAKFPLENFQRLAASTNDEERKAARMPFIRDVRKHIDAIATKYIKPDEGTLPFALMYIPAENVYYEAIIRDENSTDAGLFQYALERRVVPVSPNSFYAYLQTILMGLKGLRVEESAREVSDNIERLRQDFTRFVESFALVGKHLENARKNFEDSDKRLGRVAGKMEDLDTLVKGLDASKSALPAASGNGEAA